MALMRRVRVVWTGVAGSPAYSNFYAVTADNDGSQFKAAVGNLITSLAEFVVTPVIATIEGEVPLIDSATGDIQGVSNQTPQTIPATSTGIMLPRATQLVLRWRTQEFVNGRRVQGRTSIPYISVALDDDGRVDAGFAAQINADINSFLTEAGSDFVIWAKTSGGAAQVSAGSVWPEFGVMRSRRD